MITIKKAVSKEDYKDFVMFPSKLYKNSKYWVSPIIKEELEMMDKEKNPVFKNAEAEYYLAIKNNMIVGRIAAIVNWVEVKEQGKNKVRFGWYDVIDDLEVSKKLLESVIEFGNKRDLSFIEGPVGFSNMDKAGLLTHGFDELNTMITWYHNSYQKDHLEKLKMKKLAEWVEYRIQIYSEEDAPKKVKKFSDLIMRRYKLKALNFKRTNDIIPYIDEMFDLLNKTYNSLQTFVPIQQYQVDHYKNRYLRYIHPEFIKSVADENGKLIAFAITMPSFSRALKEMNGKLFPFGFLRILKAQRFNDKASLYLIGVHPDYQNKGVTAILFNDLQSMFNKRGIKEVETNPELVENKSIQAFWKNYESVLHKKRCTFTKTI
ncbi:GNAT family N-acetyltransferase [Flavobacteriaceae bacterium]|jgi:GNAT superfamily N-acetyltransferase|nr:GNAT family N-acetyltransferase [Flavobacteriaceae bacterium]|tara:strand:+ start:498 stop:1622 length:1125 start_codon:yes stop_codon:yes gene_type:complete